MARRKSSHLALKIILILITLAIIVATAYVIKLSIELASMEVEAKPSDSTIQLPTRPEEPTDEDTEPTETTEPEPPKTVTASISAQGDLLMHGPVIKSCALGDGSYDFESNFRYIAEYISSYDYALANLETTFGGDSSPYQGWPLFNVPDEFADAIVDAGYDMLLTANNHTYDTLMTGLNRTLEVSRERGLDTLGTRLSEEEQRYSVVDINGIKVGMVCYTFTTNISGGKPMLNGNSPVENPEQVNYFSYGDLNSFYSDVEAILSQMESEGAEATVFYIHWGNEYEIQENGTQNTIAQKLCDLGIDVIVGGHPHVVQPIELLSSTVDPERKTVCIYSVGNALSNQRISEMRLKTGHTEDGVLFAMTFEKVGDGSAYLSEIEVLPTWVNFSSVNGKMEYNILPLDIERQEEWKRLFNLNDNLYTCCVDSYERTMDIVGEGLAEVNAWLETQRQAREAA